MRNNVTTYLLFVLFSAGYIQNASAQNKLKNITDGNTVMVGRTFLSDTLLIQCDTIYVFNKPTFKLYEAAYDKWRTKSKDFNNLIANYDNLILKQEEIINTKEEYYQQLKSKFDSLVGKTNVFIDKTTTNISEVSSSLDKVTANLNEIDKLLGESIKSLETERTNNWKRTLKFGVGGFTIGVTVAALFFLIAK